MEAFLAPPFLILDFIDKELVRLDQKYKDYKTIYRSILRKAKNNYYQDKFHEYNRKIKQTWNVLRKVLKSNNLKSDIPDQFHCNGKIFSGLQEISE